MTTISKTILTLQDERVQIIKRMCEEEHASMKKIGERLGITKQRVHQLIRKIEKDCNVRIASCDASAITLSEASLRLGITSEKIRRLCQMGKIPCERKGKGGGGGSYLLRPEGIAALKAYYETVERRCSLCSGAFTTQQFSNRIICARKTCRRERDRLSRFITCRQAPSAESLMGWRKELWKRLQNLELSPEKRWISLIQAVNLSGLSKGQIVRLRMRNVVRTLPHPHRTRQGHPEHLFSQHDILLAKEVYETYEGR